MRHNPFRTRVVLAFVATATLLVGVPASHAVSPSTALCSATGDRTDDTSAVYDITCTQGTPDLTGAWHLNELNGNVTGTGPNGGTVQTGAVAQPICVTVGGTTVRYCKSIRVYFCVDSSCGWLTIYICVTYRIPKVTVCVETANRGAFDGDAVFDGTGAVSSAKR